MKFLICLLLSFSAFASALPKDVSTFIERREICDHFRGEESQDPERKKFIELKLKEFCTGSDKALADLRKKYKNNNDVTRALFNFDGRIE